MRTASLVAALSILTVGCADDPLGDAPEHDAARTARAIEDGSAEATIVLYLANSLDRDTLDDDVTLDSRAAANIVAHRAGDDGVEGTLDDEVFDDLDELDGVSYVGDSALSELLAWGVARGMTGEDVHGVLVGTIEAEAVLFAANRLSETTLDFDVALDSRAAANITADRGYGGFGSLDELDAVPYVSGRAFGKLLDWADGRGMLDDAGLVVRDGIPYDTLQDAADAAATSLTIHLFAGTYAGTTEIDSTLIVRGYATDRTILDGEGVDQLLDITAGSPCFYDLTLRNGADSWGAAADITTTGSVLFADVDFVDNVAAFSGGAIWAGLGVDLAIRDARFVGNDSGSFGGGVYALGDVTVERTLFEDNAAYGAAALYAYSSAELSDTDVRRNTETSGYHGALTLRGADLAVSDVDFYDNDPADLTLGNGTRWDGLGSGVSFTCDADGCTGPE